VTGHSRQRIPSRPALIKYNTGHVLFESRVLPTSALADCKVLGRNFLIAIKHSLEFASVFEWHLMSLNIPFGK